MNEQLVQRGRERFENMKMVELKKKLAEQQKQAVQEKYSVPDRSKIARDYPKRFIYFVVDG